MLFGFSMYASSITKTLPFVASSIAFVLTSLRPTTSPRKSVEVAFQRPQALELPVPVLLEHVDETAHRRLDFLEAHHALELHPRLVIG